MVSVDSSERGKTITHDSEQADKDVVNDVNNLQLLATDINPAWNYCQSCSHEFKQGIRRI
jgi:hypothetical protein